MADNLVANAGVGGGTIRFYSDGTVDHGAAVVEYVSGGSAGAWTLQQVDATHGLPVNILNATVAITVASLPLPAGAATAAKQPALGTAGTASADVITVQGIASMTPLKVDGSGVTQPVSGTVSITANSAVNVAQFGASAVVTGAGVSGAGIPRVTVSNDSSIIPVAGAAGGSTPYSYIVAASANQDSQSVKASAGTLYLCTALNLTTALRYLKIYDKATAPTSADTPKFRIPLPAAASASGAGAGVAVPIPAVGVAFALGLAFRVTTGLADNDTGSCTANDAVVNLSYL